MLKAYLICFRIIHTQLISLLNKGKSKVVPVFLIEHHAIKAYWGVDA